MLVLAGGVDSVMELVVVGASLPVAAGMVVSAVLFLSGEDDGTAMALSASGGLAALAANLWVAAKKGEIMLMEGCLAATECMLWVAGLMSARDPLGPSEPQDLSHVPLLLWGIFLAVSFVVSTNASIADHVLAQCSLFAAAMMVGCSFSLLSEEDVQGGSEFWGWLLVVMSLILVAAAKQQGKMMMVMTSLASFLSSAAWSVRILAGDGDVTDFQDGTLWVVVCWLLPSFALAANIVNNTADEREAAMVSATLAATVGMVYWAMHLLAPGDHPAVGFSSCMAIPVDRQCPRPAAVNIEHVAKSVEAQKIEQYVQTAKKSPAEAVKEVPSQRTSDEDRAEPVVPAVAEEEDVVSVDAVAEHASGEVTEEVIRDEAVQEVVEGSAVQNAEVEDSSALVDAVANEPVEEEPTAAAQEPAAQEPTIEVPMGEVPALEEATVEEAAAEESAAEDLMATVEAIAEEPREKATRRVEQDCTHSAENAEEIKFSLSASPGVWALVTSVPLVGKAAGSNHGGSLLAISTGAAAFLSIYMFECAFLYLAPEDAGPSVCFAPSLLVIALAVMFGCVLALPSGFSHIDAKVKLSSDDSEGGFMPLIFFCLFLTTVMTGCSVHHIAPEDLGAGACGPLIYFSRPARPVITRSCFDSLKTTAKATASRKFKTHDSAFAMARAQVEAELEARKSGMDPSAAAAHAQAEALKAHNAGPQVVAVPLAQPLVPPTLLSRLLLLADIVIVIVVAMSVYKAFLSYCKNVGLPFTWVMELSGDTYHGEVLEIEKMSKIIFADVAESHSMPHGYGVYTFACGTEYDGGWKEGKMCGVHGKLTFIEGHYYDGEWLEGKPNGHGTYTWYGGSVFMGEFKNGLPDGQGIKSWPDGDSYSGQWRCGCKHGFGKYSWTSGKSYSGGWKDDMMHGHGTYTFENGDSYTGAWNCDVQTGVGTYRWADGHSELRVFSDESAACPDSTVVPGVCPKTGKKFVENMSHYRCASAYKLPGKSLQYSPRRSTGNLMMSPRTLEVNGSPNSNEV